MSQKLLKFVPITKIDEATHTVYGLAASEKPDCDDEIWDYDYGKQAMQKWSHQTLARTVAAGQEPSLGNIRIMHGLTMGGKVTRLEFKDDVKQAWIETQPVDDKIWQQLKGGYLSAFSIGGGYAWKKKDGEHQRYGADVAEISYVDNPANPEAVFTYIKSDGSMELRKFAPRDPYKVIADVAEMAKQKAAEFAAQVDKTRNPTGNFSVQNSGEAHDFLVESGYVHERTGSSRQHGVGVETPVATYKNGNQTFTIQGDGRWDHENGHAVHTTGSGLQDLKAYLEACSAKAEQDTLNKTVGEEPMTKEEAAKIQSMLKRFNLPFTVEHLERAVKGDGLSVEEEDAISEGMGLEGKQHDLEDEDFAPPAPAKSKVVSILSGKTVGEVIDALKARSTRLTKSMYDIGQLAAILQALRELVFSSWYEAAYENVSEGGGDKADLAICEHLHEHMTGLVEVLKEIVDEETEELLATPALKGAASQINKGDENSMNMKYVEELVKAAKSLASHFKAAEAHHLKKAEHHEMQAEHHEQMAECHKAAHEHHKAQKADEAGLMKGMATHHSSMHKLHKAEAATHEAHAKLHKAFAAHCSKMDVGNEEAGEKAMKAAEADSLEFSKSITGLGTSVADAITEIKTSMTGIGDLVKTSVEKAMGETLEFVKAKVAPEPGMRLVGRDGKPVSTQSTDGIKQSDTGLF